MRKWNTILSVLMLLIFMIHGIMGSFMLNGVGSSAGKLLAWIGVGILAVSYTHLSMPGMMDTILNLGLNEEVVETLAEASGNARWAWDCYRRFIQMYSDVVMEVGKKYFEELIDKMKEEKGVTQDVEPVSYTHLRRACWTA